jgi:hypothetical protein
MTGSSGARAPARRTPHQAIGSQLPQGEPRRLAADQIAGSQLRRRWRDRTALQAAVAELVAQLSHDHARSFIGPSQSKPHI